MVLGAEPSFPVRAARALNHQAVSPPPELRSLCAVMSFTVEPKVSLTLSSLTILKKKKTTVSFVKKNLKNKHRTVILNLGL